MRDGPHAECRYGDNCNGTYMIITYVAIADCSLSCWYVCADEVIE